uniref:Tetraspanin n=1 Tax=Callorhinchus milii TaxID=7868 RepID=V9L972_CALMI
MGETRASTGVKAILIFGNLVLMMAGIALFAETIWVVTDPYRVYPVLGASGKDDVFAGAWIAIFTGFSFFLLSIAGIVAVVRESRTMVLTYLVLMLIVYFFECASAITSITHRDYIASDPSFLKKQMLQFYSDESSDRGRDLTRVWNRIMDQEQCCGSRGPIDWVEYTSYFRTQYNETQAPWPFRCCTRDADLRVLNQRGCFVGLKDFVFQKGCFDYFSTAVNRYAWAVSWFGFAILMWTFFLLVLTIYYYTTL